MIKIRNESEFRNWFKKDYQKLGFSKIIKSNSNCCPDFILLENDEEVKVELEIKTSNFYRHGHSLEAIDRVICVIEDVKLPLPTIKIKNVRLINLGEKAPYSFTELTCSLFKKGDVFTTSEVARALKINRETRIWLS